MRGVFNVKESAIWHAIAPTYSAITVIIMDMLPWTAWIRYCHLAHRHATGLIPMIGIIDPPLDIIATPDIHNMITGMDPDLVIPSPAPVNTDIGVAAARTPAEATPGHSTDPPDIVSYITEAQVPTITTATHHTADLHLIGIIPEMTADLNIQPENNTTDQPMDPPSPHKQHLGKIGIRDTNKPPLMTHHQNTTAQMIMTVTQRMI